MKKEKGKTKQKKERKKESKKKKLRNIWKQVKNDNNKEK